MKTICTECVHQFRGCATKDCKKCPAFKHKVK